MSPRIRRVCIPAALLACLLLAACPGKPPSSAAPEGPVAPKAGFGPPAAAAGWRHKGSSLITRLGSARHSAVDAVNNPGMPAAAHGKFAYGTASKDLQDEEVWLLVETESGYEPVESGLTDSDGRVTLTTPGMFLARPGPHPYRFVVSGDLSEARGVAWVVARGQKVVVFDIDGTLTTGDSELVDDLFGGDIDVRPGAADVVRYWAESGHTVVYLTGRPYMYNASTRAWLEQHGFPAGPMATANSLSQAVPSAGGVGAFKRAWLRALREQTGVDIVAAYGNANTDICAFAQAGIPPSATYIIDNDTPACEGYEPVHLIADYPGHLASLRAGTE